MIFATWCSEMAILFIRATKPRSAQGRRHGKNLAKDETHDGSGWCWYINGDFSVSHQQNHMILPYDQYVSNKVTFQIPYDPAGAGILMLTNIGGILMGSMAHHI